MKGIPWTRQQDDMLRSAWANPYVSSLDIAIVCDIPVDAVKMRARTLQLPLKGKTRTVRQLASRSDCARVWIGGDGGHVVLLDHSDVQWFLSYPGSWCVHKSSATHPYVVNTIHLGANVVSQKLHRLLVDAPAGVLVDHINRDTLDNRRSNLRLADRSQNSQNSGPRAHSLSDFKGVWLHPQSGRWHGRISAPNGRRVCIGYYDTEEAAARAHDAAAKLMRGEFAYLNMPENPMTPDEVQASPALRRIFRQFGGVT